MTSKERGKTGPHPAPPEATRFQKGQSGNPKGRPRGTRSSKGPGHSASSRPASGSAFDVILDKTLTVTQGGRERALTMDEALQLKTYQAALAGSRSATRMVLKMIARREKAIAAKGESRPRVPVELLTESVDPSNADAAMLALGIAHEDEGYSGPAEDCPRILLEPWAVQMALGRRRGGAGLTDKNVTEITRCTRDAQSLVWPRSLKR